MSSLNDIKVNTSWDFRQCSTNNNNANFYVKLIHINRYGLQGKNKKPKSKLSMEKQRQSILSRYQTKQRQKNVFVPSQIIQNVPLWNNRPKTKSFKTQPSNQFQLTVKPKSQLKYRNTEHRIHGQYLFHRSQTPFKQQRAYTQSINSHFKKTQKLQNSPNKTFYFDEKLTKKIMKTQPNQYDYSNQKNISFLSKSSKKPTIKELLFYQPDKVLKSKQTAIKNFRKSLKRARLSQYNFQDQI